MLTVIWICKPCVIFRIAKNGFENMCSPTGIPVWLRSIRTLLNFSLGTWHFFYAASSAKKLSQHIYAVQEDTQTVFSELVLFSTYVSSTCFGPHRSIIRSVFYKLYSHIWYVVINSLIKPLCVSCWTAYILQDDTRSSQYQVNLPKFNSSVVTKHTWVSDCYLLQCDTVIFGILSPTFRRKHAFYIFNVNIAWEITGP